MLYSEKLKPKLIKAGMRHIRNESAEEIACAQDMFETIFKDYKQEKDVHISGLLADLMHQKPVSEADFAALAGKILLILPDQDFFSGKMQQDLIKLMHDPQIAYVSGGHLSTALKTDGYRALKHREEKARRSVRRCSRRRQQADDHAPALEIVQVVDIFIAVALPEQRLHPLGHTDKHGIGKGDHIADDRVGVDAALRQKPDDHKVHAEHGDRRPPDPALTGKQTASREKCSKRC